MTRYPNKDIRILAAATRRFSCERPEHRLKHGLHTPLSEGVSEAVQAALSKAGAELPEDGTTVGLIGTSRFGELSTLNHVTSRFQAEGIFAIDPVVFSKANQFYTVFATARQFGVTGASSSLFTSDSGAAEGLYYAMQLLRQGDAGHVLVLDAEEDAVASGAPLTGRVCTVLVGPDTREGFGPILSGCALGPHLDTNGRRSSLLKAHLDRRIGMGAAERRHVVVASPSDADTIADLVRSPAVHVEDAPDATAPALASLPGILSTLTSREPGETEVHVVPPTAGNILSVRLRVDGAGRETLT